MPTARSTLRGHDDDARLVKDDARLVKAAQSGDRHALDRLLRRHHDMVYAICRRLAGNDADGMDAAQEALIAIVRGLPQFGGRARFTTWAYRVATNAALDELRRRQRRPEPGLPSDEGRILAAGAATDPSAAADRLDIDAALADLSEEFRAPVVLRDVAGCNYAEIAAILRIPPGTVRSRIARGRARLAEALRVQNGDPPPERTPNPPHRPQLRGGTGRTEHPGPGAGPSPDDTHSPGGGPDPEPENKNNGNEMAPPHHGNLSPKDEPHTLLARPARQLPPHHGNLSPKDENRDRTPPPHDGNQGRPDQRRSSETSSHE